MSSDESEFMPASSPSLFVITGGPGAGKTALIDALAVKGFAVVPEAGRQIIREQKSTDETATHDGDRLAYRRLMFEREMESYAKMAAAAGPVFFDRGLPDLIGYSYLIGAAVPAWLDQAVRRCRYNKTIFIAPPWPEIYGTDDERKQGFAEAVATHDAMCVAYEEAGYRLCELPLSTVADRIRFVLDHIQAGGTSIAQSGNTPGSISKTSGPSA
ncbi:MAG: ATPase [Parvibaculum sp.]|jgi:predicted ATPase|nr:ATPase [Parvibaculum sp.]HCX68611.1 ATPase [Rhodobiaceae bacterium]